MTDDTVMTGTLTFVAPPPGLSPLVDFDLEPLPTADGLYTLRAQAAPDVRLFVVDAPVYLPDYRPEVTQEQLESIGASATSDVRVLVVASIGQSGPSANLMAPILLNVASGEAAQVILDGDDWPLRAPLGS
jgi:flagellar assembly factor FliW